MALPADRPFAAMVSLLLRYPAQTFAALGAFVIKDTPLWLLPVISSSIVDVVVRHGAVQTLLALLLLAAVSLAQNYPMHWLYVRWYSDAVRRLGVDMRNTLTERLQRLSIGYHSRTNAAVIQSKVVHDVENVENTFIQVGHPFISAVIVMIGAIVMTAIRLPLFLPVFALTVPVAVALHRILMRRAQSLNTRFRRDAEQFASTVGDMASMVPLTRAHGLEATAQQRVAESAERLRSSGYSLDVLNGRFQALSWITMQLLSISCVGFAAYAALTGLLPVTAGDVVLVSSYFAILAANVTNILTLMPLISRGLEAVRSIAEVLNEPDLEFNEGRSPATEVRGRIAFDRVDFRFEGQETDAVRGLTLQIEEGETVAFVGPSGSGKSTLINLALGFLRPRSGRLLLDGVDAQLLDMRSFRRRVSIVPQEPLLFEGTIRDNIRYGLPSASDAQVREALAEANALEFVEAQPDGLDTMLGQRGSRLSGGQRQRLAIARALIRDPRVLFLDEATSALDAESERLVQQALARVSKDRTTLVVAHRLATIRSADRIVVLDRGEIAEIGTHEELIAHRSQYFRLHSLQSF